MFWNPSHAFGRSLRGTAKSPDCPLIKVYTLQGGAHHTPEATGSGAALAFKSSHSLTTGISQICDVISRSKSPMMKVICDVMRSSFPFAGWRRFSSGVGFIYLFKLSLIKLSL
jgi:hypothetical protein